MANDREADALKEMMRKTEAAIARQRDVVGQFRQGGASSPLAELQLRVLEDILRRHKDRMRSLNAAPQPYESDATGLEDSANRSLATA